jgi:predicted transcriptional regulator
MPCVKPDGSLEPLARAILRALARPRCADEIVDELRVPLYRVRSTLREIVEAGLAVEAEGQFCRTPAGEERVRAQP